MTVRIELPAVWLDQVVLDDLSLAAGASYFRAINRNPEPAQDDVRIDSLIRLDLATDAADSPAAATTQVFVTAGNDPEVLAYDGGAGGFQTGWNGPASATSSPDVDTLRIEIDPTTDFGSLQNVTVRVLATSTGSQALNQSWAFTIEDVTAPVLVSAKATGKEIVRVTFNEPMDATTAVVPGNYTFTRQETPAVNVVAKSVAIVTSAEVDVTLDIEMTPGLLYRIQTDNVKDLKGNVIVSPSNTADFRGFVPQIPEDRDFNLFRMIPRKNRDEDPGDLRKFIGVLQEVTDLLLCSIDQWTDIIDPDIAPEAFVDAMLLDLGNPFNFDLTLVNKRRLLRILVPVYQQKGTAVGIVNAVRFFLGIEVTIVDFVGEGWVLGEDELGDSTTEGTAILGPGTSFSVFSFDIQSPIALTQAQRDQITEIANFMKPGHTHLIKIVEPTIPTVIDHLELGLSELGVDWLLH